MPVYLIERTKKVGATAFIPIAWFTTVTGALLTWAVGLAVNGQVQPTSFPDGPALRSG